MLVFTCQTAFRKNQFVKAELYVKRNIKFTKKNK